MTTTLLTCAYSMTAVGPVPVATMAARFAAVPVSRSLLEMVGLLYAADATATVGQVVTRTITIRARPTTNATATAARFPGNVSGSPLSILTLTGAGADYAAPPIIDLFSTGTPNRPATASAQMGVGRGIVIAGGTGYVAPTIAFTGGELPLEGVQATATITEVGGVLQAPTIVTPGGPYQVPPTAIVTDTGGSGGLISPSLLVTGVTLMDPGFGYETAPTPNFIPFFSSCCPDTQPTSQIAMVINWMTSIFQAALQTPIKSVLPVIT
jgi:hypothetical protein